MIFDFDIPSKLPPGEMKSGLAFEGRNNTSFFPLYIEISNDSSFSEFLIRQISQTFLTWRLLIDLTLNLTFRRIISPNIVALPSPIFHSSTILRKLAGRIR